MFDANKLLNQMLGAGAGGGSGNGGKGGPLGEIGGLLGSVLSQSVAGVKEAPPTSTGTRGLAARSIRPFRMRRASRPLT